MSQEFKDVIVILFLIMSAGGALTIALVWALDWFYVRLTGKKE